MQTAVVTHERDRQQIEMLASTANADDSVLVIFGTLSAHEAEAFLQDVAQPFVIFQDAGFIRDVTHKHLARYGTVYLVVAPRTTRGAHYETLYLELTKGDEDPTFTGQLCDPQLHPVQPDRMNRKQVVYQTAWHGHIGVVPLGEISLLDHAWDWKTELGAISLPTEVHGYIPFPRGKVFVLTDKRLMPKVSDWPVFFKVEDGGHGESSVFRPVPLALVPTDRKPVLRNAANQPRDPW